MLFPFLEKKKRVQNLEMTCIAVYNILVSQFNMVTGFKKNKLTGSNKHRKKANGMVRN